MKRTLLLLVVFLVLGVFVSACGTPPPLKSDKYLNDDSVISASPCGPPCFHDITIGQTNFTDAVTKLKANPLFSNVQTQDKPAAAAWAPKDGETCCQLTADEKGVINSLVLKVTPKTTVKQIVDKLGPPEYVSSVDYTPQEVALGLVYRKAGLIIWVTPGDPNSTLDEQDPVVIVLYLDQTAFDAAISMATLQGWNGYQSYQTYKGATPVLTPRVTPTAQ
jgi:hypothetical protein